MLVSLLQAGERVRAEAELDAVRDARLLARQWRDQLADPAVMDQDLPGLRCAARDGALVVPPEVGWLESTERAEPRDAMVAAKQTGPEATVSKLLLQAEAGQPKEQRLLAIDALASIGQMDALPYLIEMTADGDPEIANAAKGAVGTLRVNVAQRALQPK